MEDSNFSSLIWFGSGALGLLILAYNPDKLVFEVSFWGSMAKALFLIVLPIAILAGPFTIVAALAMPRRKRCPHCYHVIPKSVQICSHCGESVSLLGETDTLRPVRQFSEPVKAAIGRGMFVVNVPIPFIMIGIWLSGLVIGVGMLRAPIVAACALPIGFVIGWLWWSVSLPRWRKWALTQEGVSATELQAAAEVALLAWPKGHFFEKTEIRPKD